MLPDVDAEDRGRAMHQRVFAVGRLGDFELAVLHRQPGPAGAELADAGGGSKLPGRLEKKINEDLGGLEKFKTDFAAAGVGQFGSGWAWLSVKNGKLEISKTPNGENPLVHGATPILGVDVWEHSYYIDYRNRRPDYLKAFVDHLVNWDYVDELFSKA